MVDTVLGVWALGCPVHPDLLGAIGDDTEWRGVVGLWWGDCGMGVMLTGGLLVVKPAFL